MYRKTSILFALLVSVVIAICALTPTAATAASGASALGRPQTEQAQTAFNPQRILVLPKKGIAAGRLASLHGANQAKRLKKFARFDGLEVIEVPKGMSVATLVAKYEKSGLVQFAEPDSRLSILTCPPNDPKFDLLWNMDNTNDADIDAPEAWCTKHDATWIDENEQEHEVVVAVIDTGVDYNHADLAANMWMNSGETPGNSIDDDSNGYIDDVHGWNAITNTGACMDDHGHGTHCSGTIGAVGDNELGIAGVCWNVKIMACKFLSSGGSGWLSDAIEAINYAMANGADIMSNSWGGGGYSESLKLAIENARDANIIFVASAGNSGLNTDYFAAYPAGYDVDNIVSVAATNNNDQLASFSNYGIDTVDLAAPGVDIISLRGAGTDMYHDGLHTIDTYYYRASGTSMACPHVSGALALLKAAHPDESYTQLINRVLGTVDPLESLAGKCVTEGRLNLYGALTGVITEMRVSPTAGSGFGGDAGGPFVPSGKEYKITNRGSSSLGWSVSKSENWLTLSATSGTLSPGQTTTVTVSINSNANSLSVGTYTDSVEFVNETNGSGDVSLEMTLYVSTPMYVSTTGNDTNNGSSWTLAKATIQDAIDAAYAGQSIFVAQGTYDEQIVMKSNVKLYGGYSGSGTTRDPKTYITAIDTNYSVLGSILTIPGAAESGTLVDGFTITHGNGMVGANIKISTSASPTISNNVISDSWGTWGPGVFCDTGSMPLITGNLITNNWCGGAFGGGVYISNASPTITSNRIIGNVADWGGGIMIANYSYGDAVIANNLFEQNIAYWGGGILANSSPGTIINNTFVGNYGQHGAAVCVDGYGSLVLANNLISENASGIDIWDDAVAEMTNNCVYGNALYDYRGVDDPTGTDGNISVDPMMAGSRFGNFHITLDSPCKDAGDNDAVGQGWTDIDGQSRVQDDTVDIGADESDGTAWSTAPPVIVRVKMNGSDSNDGSTWTLAKETVQAAIDAAAAVGGEVWVEAGTYQESITIKRNVHVYGGFAGTETDKGERNWVSNVTTLDGGGTGTVVSTELRNYWCRLDGFTVTNGATGISWDETAGTVINNHITENVGGQDITGGIATSGYGIGSITANVIDHNGGQGVWMGSPSTLVSNWIEHNGLPSTEAIRCDEGGSGLIANNIIANNGAGIYGIMCDATVENNTIVGNAGAGIANSHYDGNLYAYNNIIVNNGYGVMNESYEMLLRNNDVWNNTGGNYMYIDPGEGDISENPSFDLKGTYHLRGESPCRNAGYPDAPGLPIIDIDGHARVYEIVDIGADEFMPWSQQCATSEPLVATTVGWRTNPTGAWQHPPVSAKTGQTIYFQVFEGSYELTDWAWCDWDTDEFGVPVYAPATWFWTWGDGASGNYAVPGQCPSSATHVYNTADTYTVDMDASDSSYAPWYDDSDANTSFTATITVP